MVEDKLDNRNDINSLITKALWFAIFTIAYNIIEGIISVAYGLEDETLALFGFGVDSFVEVISGFGILHMIIRMRRTNIETRDKFEKTALKITGTAFYILTFGLIFGSAMNLIYGVKPHTTIVGVIVSAISISSMYLLMNAKLKVGKSLDSSAIIADANCTKTCFYLSFVLLASSLLFEIFRIEYFDILGSIGIAYFAYGEGKEAFEKVRSGNLSCSCECGSSE